MKELEDMINTVIDSDKIVSLVQNLINESLRHKNAASNQSEEQPSGLDRDE